MNNRERAEMTTAQTVANKLLGMAQLTFGKPIDFWDTATKRRWFDWLSVEIQKALDEAAEGGRNEIRGACSQHQHEQYGDGFKAGYAAAREQAAGIANSFEPDQCTRAYAEGYNDAIDDASRAIRAMVPRGEVGK